ncbi:methionine synthase [Jatrophihabitans sp.]|uniref:methionine synthase n=1 Tax=Jatrophihabitans sp. TaxID=1932789 RepID=UPI0030C73A41|nr:Methionine synthase vitamin-B12 independent [Jatrophihabitans sp.]
MTQPWPAGSATGLGSLPGTDPAEATRLIFGELPDLPHLPELPARGAGADMIGRAVSLLVDLPVEIVPSGWRLTARAGRDLRVARDFLSRDLDALQEVAGDYTGALKLQACGPWTLAAAVELPTGHRVVSDHGATRELGASLAEGLSRHLAEVQARVPGARLVLQLDEPSLPAVLAGAVKTPSGWGTVRSVQDNVVEQLLGDVLALAPAGGRLVHCCAPEVPIALLRGAGADAIALDATLLTGRHTDAIGELLEGGGAVLLGVVPSSDDRITIAAARDRILRLWNDLAFDDARLGSAIVPTPSCGMAGASPGYARKAMEVLREVGHGLLEDRS